MRKILATLTQSLKQARRQIEFYQLPFDTTSKVQTLFRKEADYSLDELTEVRTYIQNNPEMLQQELEDFLNKRWIRMRKLGFTYTATAQSPLSILCQKIAKYLARNGSSNKYLMYDLHELDETIVEGLPSITERQLDQCITIINEKGTSLVPVNDFLSIIATEAQDLTHLKFAENISRVNPYTGEKFSSSEKNRLWNFSKDTIELKEVLQKCREYCIKPGTLVDGLEKLCDALEKGGVSRLGEEYNAAGVAYEGLANFKRKFLDKLSDEQRKACKNYTTEEWLPFNMPLEGRIIEEKYPISLWHIGYVLTFKPIRYSREGYSWEMPSGCWFPINHVEIPDTQNNVTGNNITLLNCVQQLAGYLRKILATHKINLENIIVSSLDDEEKTQIEQKQNEREEVLPLLVEQMGSIVNLLKNKPSPGTDILLEGDPVFEKYWLNPQDITLDHIVTDLKSSYRLGQEVLITAIACIPKTCLESCLDSIKAIIFYYKEVKALPYKYAVPASHIFKLFEQELSMIDPNQLQTYLNSLEPYDSRYILKAIARGVLHSPGEWIAVLRMLDLKQAQHFLRVLTPRAAALDLQKVYQQGGESALSEVTHHLSPMFLFNALDSLSGFLQFVQGIQSLPYQLMPNFEVISSDIFGLLDRELTVVDPRVLQADLNKLDSSTCRGILKAFAQEAICTPGKWVDVLNLLDKKQARRFLRYVTIDAVINDLRVFYKYKGEVRLSVDVETLLHALGSFGVWVKFIRCTQGYMPAEQYDLEELVYPRSFFDTFKKIDSVGAVELREDLKALNKDLRLALLKPLAQGSSSSDELQLILQASHTQSSRIWVDILKVLNREHGSEFLSFLKGKIFRYVTLFETLSRMLSQNQVGVSGWLSVFDVMNLYNNISLCRLSLTIEYLKETLNATIHAPLVRHLLKPTLHCILQRKEINLCDLNYLSRHLNEDERDSIFPIILQAFKGKEVDISSGYDLAQFLKCLSTDQAILICRSIKSLELLRKVQAQLGSRHREALESVIREHLDWVLSYVPFPEGYYYSSNPFFQPPSSSPGSYPDSSFRTRPHGIFP